VHQQTMKFIKQEMRREIAERNKFMLAMHAGLDQLQNPNVQRDVLNGAHGAPLLKEDDLVELNELYKILKPSLREPDFAAKIETGAEIVAKLFESRGKINNKPSQQVKSLIDSIVESQYFKSGPVTSVPIETVHEETSTATETQPQPPPQQQQQPVHPPEVPMPVNNPVSAQMMIAQDREMTFSFIQESQLEIESPHMDPAVVAVSSFAPPPPQIQSAPENNHVFKPTAPPAESLNNIQPGIRDLNLNHMNSNNAEEEEEWDDKMATTPYINSTNVNGNLEGDQDNTNGLDRGSRGAYRGRGSGGRGRGGRGNGYGNSRPPRTGSRGGGGGFNNHKGGYFRADRIGQSDTEPVDFRGKGSRGYSRSFRGNGNGPAPGGPSLRRGARPGGPPGGAPKTYNGIHEPRPEN